MKILIIQTAYIGDLILTLPLIQTLKLNFPESEIDLLCIPYTKSVVDNNPFISNVIIFDKHKQRKIKDILSLSSDLKKKKYDYAFLPHRSLRSGLIALLSGIKIRIGFRKYLFDFIYTESIDYNKNIHEIERNLSLLKIFDIKIISKLPLLYPDAEDKKIINEFIETNKIKEKYICIAPGSKWFTKMWPREYYVKLITMLLKIGFPVVLIGGNDDLVLCNMIANETDNLINACGSFSILQTTELIRRSILLISNDSAPIHIATATNTPAIDIFGPTVPEIGFSPLSNKSISIEFKDLNCRPCKIHGGKKCPVGTFDCMKKITPEYVFDVAKNIINNSFRFS